MPYTGNLLRLSQKPDALKLVAPSPRHGVREGAPEIQREQQSVAPGTGSEFQGTDFENVVESGHGMVLNTPASWAGTPPGTADADSPYRIDYTRGNPHASTAILSAKGAAIESGGAGRWGSGGYTTTACEADTSLRGWSHSGQYDHAWRKSTFWQDPLFAEQQPREEINPDGPSSSVEGPGGVGGAKYGRGINALGENNPDGWRNGRYRFSTWPNRVFTQIHRTIGTQSLQPRDIYTPGPHQRMVTSMVTPPSLPRDAPNPDDVIMAQSTYSSSPNSVIGGGF